MAEDKTLALARHYVEVDRAKDALAALERASGDELEHTEFWLIRTEALLQLEQYRDAIEAAQSGLARDPEDISLLSALAIGQIELGEYDPADKTLAAALELDPDNSILHSQRAIGLARKGDFGAARAAVDDAMRIAPGWAPVLRARAQVAVLSGDRNAARYVDEFLAEDPDDPVGHALKGNLAIDQKRFVPAARAFSEAARLEPADAELASVAREARVAAHPVLAPARAMWRFGRWRSWFLYLTIGFALAAARLDTLRIALVIVWLTIVALSWFGPPLLRWRERRRYGGF